MVGAVRSWTRAADGARRGRRVSEVERTRDELRDEARRVARRHRRGRRRRRPRCRRRSASTASALPAGRARAARRSSTRSRATRSRVLAPEISRALGIGKGAIAGVIALKTLALALAPLPMAALAHRRARRALLCIVTGGRVERRRHLHRLRHLAVGPASFVLVPTGSAPGASPRCTRRCCSTATPRGTGARAERLRGRRRRSATSSRRCSSRFLAALSASRGAACSSSLGVVSLLGVRCAPSACATPASGGGTPSRSARRCASTTARAWAASAVTEQRRHARLLRDRAPAHAHPDGPPAAAVVRGVRHAARSRTRRSCSSSSTSAGTSGPARAACSSPSPPAVSIVALAAVRPAGRGAVPRGPRHASLRLAGVLLAVAVVLIGLGGLSPWFWRHGRAVLRRRPALLAVLTPALDRRPALGHPVADAAARRGAGRHLPRRRRRHRRRAVPRPASTAGSASPARWSSLVIPGVARRAASCASAGQLVSDGPRPHDRRGHRGRGDPPHHSVAAATCRCWRAAASTSPTASCRCCSTSTSPSTTARWSRCSASTAPASRRC